MIELITKRELQLMYGSIEKAAGVHGKTKQAFYQAINKQTDVCDRDLTIKVIGTAILEGHPERLPARFIPTDVVSCMDEEELTQGLFIDAEDDTGRGVSPADYTSEKAKDVT